jgi:ribosomal protein S18 acetylase RimI-like enzyme
LPEHDPSRCFKVSLEVEVRAAEADDLPALEWLGLYSPHRQIMHDAFEAQSRGDALLLLGMCSGYPIAQVWIDFARERQQGIAIIWAVRTFFPLQGRGIGRRMMAFAEEEIAARGIRKAELHVELDNDGALRFYRRHGWHVAGNTTEQFTAMGPKGEPELQTLAVRTMQKALSASLN